MMSNLLTQLPFFICFFWFLFFSMQRNKSNQKSRDLLAFFMLVGSMMHLSHIAYFNQISSVYIYFDWLFLFSSLLIAPSYYLYVLSVARGPIKLKDLNVLLPGVIFITAYSILFSGLSDSERMTYINDFVMQRQKVKFDIHNPIHQISILFIINRITFSIQTIYFVIRTVSVIKNFKSRVKNIYSNSEGKELNWISTLIITILAVSILSTVFNILDRSYFINNILFIALPSILFSAILFMIGSLGNTQKFTITELILEEKATAEIELETNKDIKTSIIRKKLEELIVEKQVFLTKDLRITDLCQELNTNRTYLSHVFNDELKENFNSFINKHRVNYAISLLNNEEWKQYSLEKFADLSGFGSTTSMIRAFKQSTGKTPSEYRM